MGAAPTQKDITLSAACMFVTLFACSEVSANFIYEFVQIFAKEQPGNNVGGQQGDVLALLELDWQDSLNGIDNIERLNFTTEAHQFDTCGQCKYSPRKLH